MLDQARDAARARASAAPPRFRSARRSASAAGEARGIARSLRGAGFAPKPRGSTGRRAPHATLTGPVRPASAGTADSLVIFLHGYGADGNDLIGLAEPLAPHLPDTRFLAPNAPERCPGNPMGFQWFPIPWLDGTPEAVARASAVRSFGLLDAWLDDGRERGDRAGADGAGRLQPGHDDGAARGPAPARALAGIVGFSGRLLDPERLAGGDHRAAAGAAGARRPGPRGALREPRRGRARR